MSRTFTPQGASPSILQSGLTRHFSPEALDRLASVTVGIAGAGGLGSNCAMLLARSGIRNFIIADFDEVEPSNLNRQYYFPEDIGELKVEALALNLMHIEPGLTVVTESARLDAASCAALFAPCQIVVEALDNPEYKAELCNALLEKCSCQIVSASGMGGIGGADMTRKRLGQRLVCVGDFSSEVSPACPPLAPRVMQAAALQADCVLDFVLNG